VARTKKEVREAAEREEAAKAAAEAYNATTAVRVFFRRARK
jgi:hypothetical protein